MAGRRAAARPPLPASPASAASPAPLLLLLLLGSCAVLAQSDSRADRAAAAESGVPEARAAGGGGAVWWWWRCEAGRCVRDQSPGAGARASLALCRLTCGAAGALWPRPTGAVALGASLAPLHPRAVRADVLCAAGSEEARFLKEATALMAETLSRECRVAPLAANVSAAAPLLVVQLCAREPSQVLRLSTNESYVLDVRADGATVTASVDAQTVFGARHALETLSQLAACDPEGGAAAPMRMVAHARVADAPAFAHRGLLLDTARHWLSERAIRRTLDAMAATKLNVLHWHATDSHSFPLLLPRVPRLARYGAYSAAQTYSAGAVARLAAYARLRGVRLLLELDAPAHAGEGWQWGPDAGLGALALCVAAQPWRSFCIQPPCGQLNPANPALYGVLRDVIRDLLDALPAGEQLHLGGDEVFLPCWNSSSEVVQWLEARGRGRSTRDFLYLWSEFHARQLRALDEARSAAATAAGGDPATASADADADPILWSSLLTAPDHIEQYVDSQRFIIHTWVDSRNHLAEDLMNKGYRVIVTVKDAWYLDHGFWGTTTYRNWRAAYNTRMPRMGRAGRLLGGEAAMWGELVDEQALDGRVWPRAAAAAERLWSDPAGAGADAAEPRLLQLRERLVRRGVRADAVTPEWCYLNEGDC